jgi:hypothetical protein
MMLFGKQHDTFHGIVKAFALNHSHFRHSHCAFAKSFESICVVAQYKVENKLVLLVLIQDVVDAK